jgi:hypothetical protein
MGMENATRRAMRYILKNCEVGDRIYAYSIAKAIGVEPQRMVRVFRRWAKSENGFLVDMGKIPMPEGLRNGPPPRFYEVTAQGLDGFDKALKEPAQR